MSLEDWLANGWLTEHTTSTEEIGELLSVADRELSDAQVPGLSPDGKLAHVFNAALQCATAALAASGYRIRQRRQQGPGHHQLTVQSLEHTIGSSAQLVRRLDQLRRKRITVTYERMGVVSEDESRRMLKLAKQLRQHVERWLKTDHSGLVSP